jgi:hypothetical protein
MRTLPHPWLGFGFGPRAPPSLGWHGRPDRSPQGRRHHPLGGSARNRQDRHFYGPGQVAWPRDPVRHARRQRALIAGDVEDRSPNPGLPQGLRRTHQGGDQGHRERGRGDLDRPPCCRQSSLQDRKADPEVHGDGDSVRKDDRGAGEGEGAERRRGGHRHVRMGGGRRGLILGEKNKENPRKYYS